MWNAHRYSAVQHQCILASRRCTMHNILARNAHCTMHCTMSNTSVYWQEVYNAHCTMISVSGTRYTLHVAHCTLRCSQFHQPTCFQVRRRSCPTPVYTGRRYTMHDATLLARDTHCTTHYHIRSCLIQLD